MAEVKSANQKLYVMQVSMSSPFFVSRSEKYEDENAKKQWYKYPEQQRKDIQAIRQSINVITDAGCARFYGLKIANEISKQQITEALAKADAEMKAIDPTLHADAQFLPLQSEAFTSGTLLDNLTAQIREQIHGVVLKRIEKTIADNDNAGMLTAKTKAALLKMLEKCRAVNVIGDEAINQRIDAMKDQINNDQIVVMRNEILALLDETKDRFSSIDMFNIKKGDEGEQGAPATASPALTDEEQTALDEEKKYDARPADPGEDEDDAEPVQNVEKKRKDSRFDVM